MIILVMNKFNLVSQVTLTPYLTREFDASIEFPIGKEGAGTVYYQYEVTLHQQVSQQINLLTSTHSNNSTKYCENK